MIRHILSLFRRPGPILANRDIPSRDAKLIPTIVRQRQRELLEVNLERIRIAEFRRRFSRDWDAEFRDQHCGN